MTTTFEIYPALTFAATPIITARRSITLKVEKVICVVAVQTSEFELPDAEFDF